MVESARGDGEKEREGAGRQAARGLGTAFKAVRLYSPGHTLTREALRAAAGALRSYVDRFGALELIVVPAGVAFDFQPRPYKDEVLEEVLRALRAGGVRGIRVLRGITEDEIGELLQVLHLPQEQIRRAGGVSILIRKRGVDNLVIDDFGASTPAAGAVSPPATDSLFDVIGAGPRAVGEQLLAMTDGDADQAVRVLQEFDRSLAGRPGHVQVEAYRVLGAATAQRTTFHRALGLKVVEALDEPWAQSIAGQWPQDFRRELIAGLPPERMTRVKPFVDALAPGPGPQGVVPPPVEPVTAADLQRAREELQVDGPRQRAYALRLLLDLLPVLDTRRFEDCLALLEREMAEEEREDPAETMAVLTALSAMSRQLPDGRAELAQVSLHRLMTVRVRDLLTRALARPLDPGDPLYQAMRQAAGETVVLLLELMAEEERLHVRREIVSLLRTFAQDRIHMLADHLVDPRWHIARNVVTVLGGIGTPEVVPYLRGAMAHEDVHVRREALAALGQLRTTESVDVLVDALRRSDPEMREGAAYWLGMTGLSQAVPPLVAVLETEPLHENPGVKREVIRALGRLATPEAAAALELVQLAVGPLFSRRQLDELKSEAARALAGIRGRPS